MALSNTRKQELAKLDLPSDADTVKRAVAFRQRSGLTVGEFSEALGYASSSLSVYLQGSYGRNLTEDHEKNYNTRAIRAALKQFMDLYDGAAIARALPPAHKTKDFLDVRRACFKALDNGTAYVVDGPPGTQKTFSLKHAVHEINQHRAVEGQPAARAVYVYARIDHSPQSFLQECCNCSGISSRGMIDQLIRKLGFFLSTGNVLFVVDEAQHLEHKGLEVLRQLLEQYHFGAVLGGSHDLTQRLSHWQMEQWHSRVRKTLYLDGPSDSESRAIIRAELEPLLGVHDDATCAGIIAGCHASASRMQRDKAGQKLVARRFDYISARDLFFTIEEIQQQLAAQRQPGVQQASQKESAT